MTMTSIIRMLRRPFGVTRRCVLRAFFGMAEWVLPVRNGYWCFCTWANSPHTLDNPRAVFEKVKNDASIRKIILQKQSRGHPVRDGSNVTFVQAESFRGTYLLARSRVVLLGYGLRGLSSYSKGLTTKHLVVQLWHGIPIRRIGRLFPRETWWSVETPTYAALVASSQREQKNLAQAFAPVSPEHIWLTGLPRNDFLLGDETTLPVDYQRHLADLRHIMKGRKLVLYAPTWRDRKEDHYVFSPKERTRLSALLRRHNAVLGIRGHPNVRHLDRYATQRDTSDIVTLNRFPDPNVILRETDVLITDYSSIYLDFLLTNRPILHFVYDYEEYMQNRIGFFYETEEVFAGPLCRTFDELVVSLQRALETGVENVARYARTRSLFHQHGTDSAIAVADHIRTLVGQTANKSRRAYPDK